MAKVLVLFDSRDQRAERLADLASEGAKQVRFTEVDVRVLGDEAAGGDRRQRRLESSDAVNQYDGVVLVASHQELSGAIDTLLSDIRRSSRGEFVDRVFGLVSDGSVPRLAISEIGGISVGQPAGSADSETVARATGTRVAKVAEWVRHALSHEH